MPNCRQNPWQALAPIPGEDVFKIDARALHGWLGVTTRLHVWIARRIDEYGFSDDEDFRPFVVKTRGRPRTDYRLTLDMAKELAMVERFGRHPIRFVILCQK